MPRKQTESSKRKRKEEEERKIEKPSDLPNHLKQATIEFHYRTGKSPTEIIAVTGIQKSTVYEVIKRLKASGASAPKSGRPTTAITSANILRVRRIIYRNPETPITEIAQRVNI